MIRDGRPSPARGFPIFSGVGQPMLWTLDPGSLMDSGLRIYADGSPKYLERLRVNHPGDYERTMLARAELQRRAIMEAS